MRKIEDISADRLNTFNHPHYQDTLSVYNDETNDYVELVFTSRAKRVSEKHYRITKENWKRIVAAVAEPTPMQSDCDIELRTHTANCSCFGPANSDFCAHCNLYPCICFMNPCEDGCSNPEMHAEGGHDI